MSFVSPGCIFLTARGPMSSDDVMIHTEFEAVNPPFWFRIVFLGLLFIYPFLSAAQKNDTIYLLNGDKITGELKKYENGMLRLSTAGMSTIFIEWDKIKTFYSGKYYEIVKASGFSYYGSIINSKTPACIDIVVVNDTVTEPVTDIVEITKLNKRFWKKFYGSFDLGISYYKSTNTLQYYFDGTLNYRGRKDLLSLGIDFFYSKQKFTDSSAISQKVDIGFLYSHFFPGKFWMGFGTKVQKNTELDLDSRFQLSVAAGYDFIHTNPIRFYCMGGVLANREKPTDSVTASTNFEGIVAMKFTWLKYRFPDINISTDISYFPSLSIQGRHRLEYNLSAKFEIFRDFFFGLTFYDDYDSKPSGGGPALNDWSAVFTVGYSF